MVLFLDSQFYSIDLLCLSSCQYHYLEDCSSVLSFISFFLIWVSFTSFSCLISLTSRTALTRSGESGHHFLFPDCREKFSVFYHWACWWLWVFQNDLCYTVEEILCTLSFLSVSILKECCLFSFIFFLDTLKFIKIKSLFVHTNRCYKKFLKNKPTCWDRSHLKYIQPLYN